MRCFAIVALISCFVSTLVAADPSTVFNGKDTKGWKVKGSETSSKWVVGYAELDKANPGKLVVKKEGTGPGNLVNADRGVDIFTEQKYGDAKISLELMVPKGSNSGIYVMGEYEVQILDSFGKDKVGPGDLGGLYGSAAPKSNASKAPGEWQKMEIEFQAPKFEGDKKVSNAKFVKITLNGTVIHENIEVKGSTGGALTGKEVATGPLMIQGDHGPVALRNIEITPAK